MAVPNEIATAYVSIVPSARDLAQNIGKELAPVTALSAAEGKKAGSALGGQFTTGFAATAAGVGSLAKGLLAGIGVTALTRSSINAASDLAESQSKVNVVFKDGAADVEKWSQSAATGLGISKQSALEAASTFGNFLISMGLIPKKAQDMSVALVGLASDLASFNNTSPEDALLAIRSGLAGEIEPLRRYGVALSANRIEQEAQAAGLNKTSAEMSAAERATFAYKIILEDTSLAQGDFERTSGGLANQQRILAARVADAEAKLGQLLIPTLLTGAKGAIAFGHGLAVLNKETGGWLGTLAGAAAIGGTVFLAVNKIGSVVRGMTGAFTAQAAATTTLTAAEATNTGVTGANAVAQGELAASSGAAAVAMEGEAASAGTLGTTLKGTLAPGLAAVAIGFLGGKKAGEEINKVILGHTTSVDELTASLIRLEKHPGTQLDAGISGSKFAQDINNQVGRDAINPIKGLEAIFSKNAHQAKEDAKVLNESFKSILQTEGVDKATRAYGLWAQQFLDAGGDIRILSGDMEPFLGALDLARAKADDTGDSISSLTVDFQSLADSFVNDSARLSIQDQFDAATQAVDDLNQLKLDALGQGQKSIDAAKTEEQARQSLTDAIRSEGTATTSLAEARAKLAQFDSTTDQRIRDLELQNIQSRVVITPEEARQKEIDLLKFGEDTANRRADLQKAIASAEDGVTAASNRVADAQVAVSNASDARRQVQVDAADGIAAAERKAKEATDAVGTALINADAAGQLGRGNEQLSMYVTLLDELLRQVDPTNPQIKNLDDFLNKLSLATTLKQALAGQLPPAPFVGSGGTPPPVFQPPAPFVGPPPAKPTIDFHPTTTIHASDVPTENTLNTLNRKQGIRLTALIPA